MSNRTPRRSSKRAGYTLTEMVIVAGVLAALAGLSWPALRGPLNKSRLRNAAKQVRVDLAKTRLKAIQTGVAHQFRYQPGDNQFEIAPLTAEDDTETPAYGWTENHASDSNGRSAADSAGDGSPQVQAIRERLPEGVLFVDPSLADETLDAAQFEPARRFEPARQFESARRFESEPETAEVLDESDWSAPIVFHPNGRAVNARVLLAGQRDFHVEVTLRGLTGVVTVGQLQRREEQP